MADGTVVIIMVGMEVDLIHLDGGKVGVMKVRKIKYSCSSNSSIGKGGVRTNYTGVMARILHTRDLLYGRNELALLFRFQPRLYDTPLGKGLSISNPLIMAGYVA